MPKRNESTQHESKRVGTNRMGPNEKRVLRAFDIAHEAGYDANVEDMRELIREARALDQSLSINE
jgi:hypothetical protein